MIGYAKEMSKAFIDAEMALFKQQASEGRLGDRRGYHAIIDITA